ncbi:flavin monoamine oxidase family protein [Paraburkholderia pallida]|uniref:NAD(P)/FAD-dependent oxidoreductase n=1 Tax=Paraburkholderia pallida TaxID=2547399 RepID=A0A4P7CTK7_9BURK|nr:NAD(P)/FAD-dependent oxidoreductase [Paraburkholderia pallida]QBQ99335.1 NAD(P)/FAD-dependent oxidoreductase [Paraburkholderia pallida]
MKEEQSVKVGRRTFMRGAGSALAATALASSTLAKGGRALAGERPSLPGPESKSIASGAQYDVIVIGGGFAGLTAARDCALRGMKTLLLEARARIGGRTFTSSFAGHRLEMGGTWIHWSQPHVWDEMTRYGMGIVDGPGASLEHVSWLSGGKIKSGDAEKVFPVLADAMAKFCDVDGYGGRLVFPRPHDPLFHADEVRKYDGLSLQDRLAAVGFKQEVHDLISPQLTTLCHRDPASAGLADQLKLWALSEFDLGLLFERVNKYRIEQGTSGLANAIAADGGADVMLSTPVARVEQAGGKVSVTTASGAHYSAGAVICTVPANVLKSIDFRPGLNPAKLAASKAGVAGQGTKCYIHIKQKIGKWMGCGAFPNPIAVTWTEQERDDGTLLVSFGPPGRLDINDEDAVQTALRQILPGADVVATTGYQWTADPWSQGTWCYYRPGQLTRDMEPLRQREGAVFFASADSASGWTGTIDGAIERGTRVAQDVKAFLNRK